MLSSKNDAKHESRFAARLDVLTERVDTLASTVATTASAMAKKEGEIAALRKELAGQGLMDAVQVTTCGSIGLCERGPNMIVYPEGVWYSGVQPGDVPEIVREHFGNGRVVERLTDGDRLGARGEALEVLVVDAPLHELARPRTAVLPRVVEDRPQGLLDADVEVGVVEHDVGRLAAELERDARDVRRGRLHHRRADLGGSRERDLRDTRIGDQRAGRTGSGPGQHAQGAIGKPCLVEDVGER